MKKVFQFEVLREWFDESLSLNNFSSSLLAWQPPRAPYVIHRLVASRGFLKKDVHEKIPLPEEVGKPLDVDLGNVTFSIDGSLVKNRSRVSRRKRFDRKRCKENSFRLPSCFGSFLVKSLSSCIRTRSLWND